MRIGFHLRSLQNPSRVRGIGVVAREVIGHLAPMLSPDDVLVFFYDQHGPALPTDLLALDARTVALSTRTPVPSISRYVEVVSPLSRGQQRIIEANCDVFVQFEMYNGVPRRVPSIVFIHDTIPLDLGDRYPTEYAPTYRGARRAGLGHVEAAKRGLARILYRRSLSAAVTRASTVLVYSESTAATLAKYVRGDLRVRRTSLAAPDVRNSSPTVEDESRIAGLGLLTTPFLFFVGGTDHRRRLAHTVLALETLRDEGVEIALVFAGSEFSDLGKMRQREAADAIANSRYRDDIRLMGYVTDGVRDWLYANALAFVFPTEAEGFGLPVIESLAHGCPVIAYDNTSLPEVAGPNCELIPGPEQLVPAIRRVLDRAERTSAALKDEGRAWASRFTWDRTAADLLQAMREAASGQWPSRRWRRIAAL